MGCKSLERQEFLKIVHGRHHRNVFVDEVARVLTGSGGAVQTCNLITPAVFKKDRLILMLD